MKKVLSLCFLILSISVHHSKARSWIGDDYETFHLVRCLSHIPEILSVDSDNPQVIKYMALSSLIFTNAALGRALIRQTNKSSALQEMCITGPKVFGYLLAIFYDLLRFYNIQTLAIKNRNPEKKEKFKYYKFQQCVKLSFEFFLRLLCFMSPDHANITHSVNDIADFLEIWRLLSRYETYFGISGYELTASFSLKKAEESQKQDHLECAHLANESSSSGLETISDRLFQFSQTLQDNFDMVESTKSV